MSKTTFENHSSKHEDKSIGSHQKIVKQLALSALVATAALLATACHRQPRFCNSDPEKASEFIVDRLDDGLDWLDATPEQKSKIFGIARNLVGDFFEMKKNHAQHHDSVMTELNNPEPDRQRLHDVVDEQFDDGRVFAHKAVDKLLAAYQVLDADQQAKLLKKVEKHHKRCSE